MYSFLQSTHSYLAYVALVFPIVAWILHFMAKNSAASYSANHRKWASFGMIAVHIQLTLGLILYFVSPMGMANFNGATMKDSLGRLYILEHPLMMVIGVVLITMGSIKAKKATEDIKKFNAIVIFYGLGLVCMLSRIPWSQWFN